MTEWMIERFKLYYFIEGSVNVPLLLLFNGERRAGGKFLIIFFFAITFAIVVVIISLTIRFIDSFLKNLANTMEAIVFYSAVCHAVTHIKDPK